MDVENFQRRWRLARRAWDRINQLRLARHTAGGQLTGAERAEWLRAKSEFEACGRLWDEAYRMGVTVIVGDDGDPDDEEPA